jgi:phosphonate transport system substrate-binding protein
MHVFGTGPVRAGLLGQAARDAFAEALESRVGSPFRVKVFGSYESLALAVESGSVAFAWLPPALAVQLVDRDRATPLVSLVRDGSAEYRGTVFVRGDSSIRGVEDLRGKRFAWVDELSCAGYLFPRRALTERGFGENSFADERFLGSHAAVGRAVAAGDADAGATFLHVADDDLAGTEVVAGWADATTDAMRTLLVTDPIPTDLVCASSHVAPALAEAVGTALAALHTEDASSRILRELFGVTRFEPADIGRYEAVRVALRPVR